MDSYSSYITVNIITYCIEHTIDLLILLLQTLHMLQLLNISVFSLLKRELAAETNAAS